MSKIRTFGGVKEILKHPKFTGIAVMVDGEGIEFGECERKIVPAGTILGGKAGSIIESKYDLAIKKNGEGAEGVLLYDVDVTEGPAPASMVVHGHIDLSKIEKPTDEAKAAIGSRILFIG